MSQGQRISIKNKGTRDTSLIQTNIFDAFKNLTLLSKNQQVMKLKKENQCSSLLTIVISDESDSEESDSKKSDSEESDSENEVTINAPIGINVEEILPFSLEDDSANSSEDDGCPPKPKSSSKENVGEMMVLNKPIACSTPLRPSLTSLDNKETMDSDCTIKMEKSLEEEFLMGHNISITPEETRGIISNTIPSINILNSADTITSCIDYDSDDTIILDNSLEKKIFIEQNILITPKKTSQTCNSNMPNNAVTSTCREENERVGSRNQKVVDVTQSCKSTSTTISSHTTVEENPRQMSQMCNSSLSHWIVENDNNNLSPQTFIDKWNNLLSSEHSLSCDSSQTKIVAINQNTLKNGSDNTQTAAKNTNLQKIDSDSQKSSPSQSSMNCINPQKKSDERNQRILKSGRSDIAKVAATNSSPQKIVSTKSLKSYKKSDTKSQITSKFSSDNAEIGAKNLGKQQIESNKPEGAATEPLMKSHKKSDTKIQKTLKSSSDNAETGANNLGKQQIESNKPECAATEPLMKSHKKSDTKIQKTSKSSSDNAQTGAKNLGKQQIESNKPEGAVTEPLMKSHKKSDSESQNILKNGISDNAETDAKNVGLQKMYLSKPERASTERSMSNTDTRNQSTSKPGSLGANGNTSEKNPNSQNVYRRDSKRMLTESETSSSKNGGNQWSLESGGTGHTQTEIKSNCSQKEMSNNNNNISSSNVLQTPTKSNLRETSCSTPGKETCGESKCTSTSIGSEQNLPKVHHKEVNSTTMSIIPRTPTKRKLSDSPSTSPSKRANKTPSPKKERRMNTTYLTVFKGLFSSVTESPHLKNLIEEETPILNLIISSDPKYFYVILKLFTWLPKRYNIFRFCEKILLDMEDKEVLKLYKFLLENSIVDVDFRKEDISVLLSDLDRVALKRICEKFKLKRKLSGKKEMINALLEYCRTQSTLTFAKSAKDLILDEVLLKMGKCIKLKNHVQDAFYKVFLLGTFTNLSFTNIQDFFKSMMVTKTVFPEYKIENYCVFYTREEFTRYATARKFSDGLYEAFKNHNHIEVFQISGAVYTALEKLGNENTDERFRNVPHLKRFTAHSLYRSILSKGCEHLKTKYPSVVKKWLVYLIKTFPCSHRLANWYYQLTWLHMRYLKPIDYVKSAKLLIEILQNKSECISDVQLHKLGERGEQLKRGTNYNKIDQYYHDIIAELIPEPINLEHFPQTTVDAKAIRSNEIGRKRKYLVHTPGGDKNYLSVENVALEYYTDRCGYTDGIHCEGNLIKASFTLFFWDLIYDPEILVPATFLSKYQEVPLDMMTPYFYTNRKDAIDKRLRDISSKWSDSKTIEFVKNSFDMHSHERGLCEPGAYMKDAEMLEIMVTCIGRRVLAKIYVRLVKNVSQYSSGMPDLFVWNIQEKKCKFVEVKGENDKLSIKQNLWLKYLESVGAHIEVCIVHSIGSKKKVKCVPTSKTCIAEEGREKEQASSSNSSTPKNNSRKPKFKSGATPEKKPRTNKDKQEDNRASTSAKTVQENNDSGSEFM